ncbi:hypothetical protein [Sphingomonas sp.]|jgi:hypothetical protein|uniref:hypothetical protein n=1 Tax=Sphingomonas sp. TaxID=28214 RepID=UPI002D7F0C3F|nr:hypothetical protein [Sphingomonas sp.]HEU0045775.1 hypothetical protein [Sphingomonas sp.]
MSAYYSFDIDPIQSLVRITMGGFFTPGDIEEFASAQGAAYAQLKCPPNQHVTLVDMRAMQIQPQVSVAGFQARMNDPAVASRRIAFVVSKSLARMQIKRATQGMQARLFECDAHAEAWLLAPDEGSRSSADPRPSGRRSRTPLAHAASPGL